MNDELTLIVAKTENKDLGDNAYGGYLYNCLLETKMLAEEYQKSQLTEYLTNNKKR